MKSIIHYEAYASINDVFAHIFRSHNTSYAQSTYDERDIRNAGLLLS